MKASKEIKDSIFGQLQDKPYSQTTFWNVYKMKPSGWCTHHSLFFTPRLSPGDGFTAEIQVYGGQVHVCTNTFENVLLSKFTYVGYVLKSITGIIDLAVNCAEKFGPFHSTLNNCQNYTNLLSSDLKITEQWTDLGMAVVSVSVLLGGWALYSRYKKNE